MKFGSFPLLAASAIVVTIKVIAVDKNIVREILTYSVNRLLVNSVFPVILLQIVISI